MAKYLIQARYAGDGINGLLKDGGSARRAAVENLCKSLGGTWGSCHFGFGEFDIMGIADVPDNVGMSAICLTVRATGLVDVKATAVLTPEEMDQVAKKSPAYRRPGQ